MASLVAEAALTVVARARVAVKEVAVTEVAVRAVVAIVGAAADWVVSMVVAMMAV